MRGRVSRYQEGKAADLWVPESTDRPADERLEHLNRNVRDSQTNYEPSDRLGDSFVHAEDTGNEEEKRYLYEVGSWRIDYRADVKPLPTTCVPDQHTLCLSTASPLWSQALPTLRMLESCSGVTSQL